MRILRDYAENARFYYLVSFPNGSLNGLRSTVLVLTGTAFSRIR